MAGPKAVTDPPHGPIYTYRELAELVAVHDREHPDHGGDCSCRHGLITAARALFVSMAQPIPRMVHGPRRYVRPDVVHEPRPYVPPDVVRGTTRGWAAHDR